MTVLIYKWGRPVNPFVSSSDVNKGRKFDSAFDFIAKSFLDKGHIVEVPKSMWTSDVYPDVPRLRVIDSYSESKASLAVVLGGPENDEFNKAFVDYANNTEAVIVLQTNDHRFLELRGVEKSYRVLGEVSRRVLLKSGVLVEPLPEFNPTMLLSEETKSKAIMIQCNELGDTIEETRVERIRQCCEANPSLRFDLYGLYKHREMIAYLKAIPNLTLFNTQMSRDDLHKAMSAYSHSVIIQADTLPGSIYNDEIGYPANYICLKVWEYLFAGVVPLLDIQGAPERLSKWMPSEIALSNLGEVSARVFKKHEGPLPKAYYIMKALERSLGFDKPLDIVKELSHVDN